MGQGPVQVNVCCHPLPWVDPKCTYSFRIHLFHPWWNEHIHERVSLIKSCCKARLVQHWTWVLKDFWRVSEGSSYKRISMVWKNDHHCIPSQGIWVDPVLNKVGYFMVNSLDFRWRIMRVGPQCEEERLSLPFVEVPHILEVLFCVLYNLRQYIKRHCWFEQLLTTLIPYLFSWLVVVTHSAILAQSHPILIDFHGAVSCLQKIIWEVQSWPHSHRSVLTRSCPQVIIRLHAVLAIFIERCHVFGISVLMQDKWIVFCCLWWIDCQTYLGTQNFG